MISALLFDFGGTLDADGLHWLDRFYKIYDKVGLKDVPKPKIKEAFYWADERADHDPAMKKAGLRQMMDLHVRWQFEKLGLKDKDKELEVAEAFVRPAEKILRRNRHLIESLRHRGLKLGVISNFYGNVRGLCEEFDFLCHMDVVLDSAVVGLRKPDPKLYALALEKLELPAEQVAFVGDSFERDIVPAKSLGMKTYWIIGDSTRPAPETGRADAVIHSLEDLLHDFPLRKEPAS